MFEPNTHTCVQELQKACEMTNKILFLIGFLIISGVQINAQEISTEEWSNYFNAVYLPVGSEKGVQAAQKITHVALKQKAFPAQQLSIGLNQSHSNSGKLKSMPQAASSDDMSPETEMTTFSPLAILNEVIQLEKSASEPALKGAYGRLKNDIPWHSNVYHYADLLLKSVSAGGILLVNGEIDALPSRALQKVNSTREDVTIIHISWFMESEMYRKSIYSVLNTDINWQAGLTAGQLISKLNEQFPGRIYLSMTLPVDIIRPYISQLQPIGLTFQFTNQITSGRHHLILEQADWAEILQSALPDYVVALQRNYLAALLADEKSGADPELGGFNRNELIEQLMNQTGLKSLGKKYLNDK